MTYEPTDDEKKLIEKLRRDGARKRASTPADPELAKRCTGFAPGLDKDLNPFPFTGPSPAPTARTASRKPHATIPRHLNQFERQEEIAQVGGTRSERVLGRYAIIKDPETGLPVRSDVFEPNPYYKPLQ